MYRKFLDQISKIGLKSSLNMKNLILQKWMPEENFILRIKKASIIF